jgi:hypothetical protein
MRVVGWQLVKPWCQSWIGRLRTSLPDAYAGAAPSSCRRDSTWNRLGAQRRLGFSNARDIYPIKLDAA